jgi:hypothetical protein
MHAGVALMSVDINPGAAYAAGNIYAGRNPVELQSTTRERPEGEHLNANRVWRLIRDNGKFSPQETEHIRGCEHCADWVASFAEMARKAGFRIAFQIPSKEKG